MEFEVLKKVFSHLLLHITAVSLSRLLLYIKIGRAYIQRDVSVELYINFIEKNMPKSMELQI